MNSPNSFLNFGLIINTEFAFDNYDKTIALSDENEYATWVMDGKNIDLKNVKVSATEHQKQKIYSSFLESSGLSIVESCIFEFGSMFSGGICTGSINDSSISDCRYAVKAEKVKKCSFERCDYVINECRSIEGCKFIECTNI